MLLCNLNTEQKRKQRKRKNRMKQIGRIHPSCQRDGTGRTPTPTHIRWAGCIRRANTRNEIIQPTNRGGVTNGRYIIPIIIYIYIYLYIRPNEVSAVFFFFDKMKRFSSLFFLSGRPTGIYIELETEKKKNHATKSRGGKGKKEKIEK